MAASTLSSPSTGFRTRHSRLAAGIFLGLFLLALVAGYLVYQRLVEGEEQKTKMALNNIADVRAAAVSSWMLERLADTAVFGSGQFLGEAMHEWIMQGGNDIQTEQRILEQLKAIKSTYGYLDVCIYDINGREWISTEDSENTALTLTEKQTVMRAFASNGTEVSSIQQAPAGVSLKRLVHIATPLLNIREEPSKIPSALVMTANADMLLDSFVDSTPTIAGSTDIFLVEIRGDHVVVTASSDASSHFGDLNMLPVDPTQFIGAANWPYGTFLLSSQSGETMISVARKVSGVPWYLVTMIEQDAAQASLNRLAWLVAAIAAGLLMLFGTAVLFWWKKKESEIRFQSLQAATRAEAALQESESRLNGILASIPDVVWSFSPDLSRIRYINQSAETIYNYTVSAFLENPQLWFNTIHPEDRARIEELLRSLDAKQPVHDAEYRIIRRDGEARWLHCKGRLVADEHDRPLHIDGVATDITERKNAEQQVQQLAYHDSVTRLPNRLLLQDRLAQAMHMAVRSEKKVALLYMDLDNFKNINDSLGHHIGDMLLREIAERLLQCVREEDTVARIGGDEFLVLLPDIEKGEQAAAVAKKILATTARPFLLQEHQIHTTISIGISICPDDAQEPQLLMRHADSALYQAKGQGRDNYQFFTQELNRQIMRSSSIERQLREAMDADDLSLWYQPQIDIGKGRLTGAEVLLRWRRKDGGFLSPAEFIPIAEERGLIARIGEWSLREACLQCRRWQLQGLQIVPVAVNVSPLQFQQKEFAELVTGILADAELDATYLELEITESSIMRRAPQVAQLAARLRDAGVGISIDDFGTGYSSLSYLKQIPIDKIKIDRSFISDMLNDDDNDAITYAIVNLAHSLNLRVIAEGVESKAQIDRLRMYGCDEVQGYYYSAAVPAEEFEQFLVNRMSFTDAVRQSH